LRFVVGVECEMRYDSTWCTKRAETGCARFSTIALVA
jgi:hypothetical protein